MMVLDEAGSSVWTAEHGASSPVAGEPEGANAGHRFRIHGRLGQDDLPEGLTGAPDPDHLDADAEDEGERLRERLAQATEIDLHDVLIRVGADTVELSGTVADDGERRQLDELCAQVTHREIRSQLRPRNP
jgi:hypothetical protein